MSFVFEAAVFLVYYLFAYFSWFAFFSDMWSLKEKLLGGAWGISCKLLQGSLQWRGWGREWALHLSAHLLTVPGTRNRTWPVLGPLPLGPMRVKALVAQSCLALYDPMDGCHLAPPSMGFSRQEYWSGLPCPSPRDSLTQGSNPGLPALQADSLPSEPDCSKAKDRVSQV